MADITSAQLAAFIDQLGSATASGNMQGVQEAIRQFNLTYANNVAQLYGQNFGPGNPAPIGAATLASGQATGAIGYIPGYSGVNAGQTSAELAGLTSAAQGGAGLTGFYAPPSQSQYMPGTFVRLDPNTYDTQQNGPTQISYVLPSGQLQRVNIPQARAMGWNGDLSTMNVIPATTAIQLERAPPSQLPTQTLQGLTSYSNLNTAAMNQAVAQAGQTGIYQAPAQVYAPGTDLLGHTFQQLDQGAQQAYYMSNGSDWNAAMQKWANDSNKAITQSYQERGLPLPNQQGTPQTTLAGQQQAYAQQMGAINAAATLQANPFRQAQVIGQAGRVLAGMPTAGFQAPNRVTGVGLAGGNTQGGMGYLQQLIDDIKSPEANQQTAESWLNATPTPNKIDSASFLRSTPTTQNLILQSMQEKYGLDPTDSLTQIKNTLPQFNAPNTVGQVRRG